MTKTPEQAVIQADRIAAHELCGSQAVLEGRWDDNHVVQAFVRHRVQSVRASVMSMLGEGDHRLAHSQPASEGLREALEKIDDQWFGTDEAIAEIRSIARAALEAHPLTEPQRLGQEGEALVGLAEAARDLLRAQQDDQAKVGYRLDLWNVLQDALSTPAQAEPVAFMYPAPGRQPMIATFRVNKKDYGVEDRDEVPLYSHPPAPPQDREAVVEAMARAIYDDRPHTAMSQALAEATGLPLHASIPYEAAIAAGYDNSPLKHWLSVALDAALPLLAEERGERS